MNRKKGRGRRKTRRRPVKKELDARGQVKILNRLHQGAAAWVLAVTDRTLRQLVDAPRLPDGRYNLQLLLAWWIEREKRKIGGPSPAMERIRAAKAESAERRNAIERGRLVDIESLGHTQRWLYASLSASLEPLLQSGNPIQPAELEAALDNFRGKLVAVCPALAEIASGPPPELPGGARAAAP